MIKLFGICKPLIGVIHLPPLPGAPLYMEGPYDKVGLEELVEYALREARSYAESGFDAVIVENYGDNPYPPRPGPLQVAAMTRVATELAKKYRGEMLIGVNMLRNGGLEALAVAYASNADFIRVNSLCETRITPEGVIEPESRRLSTAFKLLKMYGSERRIKVLADIDVKHSYPLARYTIRDLAKECLDRSGIPVEALILTGRLTGDEVSAGDVEEAASVARPYGVGVVVGSGVSTANLARYWHIADGFIVGSSVKVGGSPRRPVDFEKAKAIASLAQQYRKYGEECREV